MTTVKRSIRKDMTQGPIMAHIFRMVIPMIIGIGSIISFTIVDTYFISLLGPDELAAIGFTAPVTTFVFNLLYGFAIAMSAVVSRILGAKKHSQMQHTVSIGIAMAVITAFIFSLSGYIFMDLIFKGIGASDNILFYVREYMPIWYLSAVFMAVPLVANAAMRGVGNAFWPSIVMVVFALVNLVLDPLFIFGYGVVPAFGVKGAAIATLIASVASCAMALVILGRREDLLSLGGLFNKIEWKNAAKLLLVIAIPVSLGSLILPIVSYIYTGFLADIGNHAVAGFGVVSRLEAFILIPIMAMAGGMSPFIGQNYGAEQFDRVVLVLKKVGLFITGYAIISAAVILLMKSYLADIFATTANIEQFIHDYLLYISPTYIGLYLFAVVGSALNALNRAKESLMLSIIRSFVIAVPLAAYFTMQYGAEGFLWSVIITNVISFVIAVTYIQRIRCALRYKSLSYS